MNVLQCIERENIDKLTGSTPVPSFRPGDTLRVHIKVVEGTRERTQTFEGMCIARRNAGMGSSFLVRKITSGEAVERRFALYSPRIRIECTRQGAVRRNKLYYFRGLRGKKIRVAERKQSMQIKTLTPETVS